MATTINDQLDYFGVTVYQLLQLPGHFIRDHRKAVLDVPWQVLSESGQLAHQNHEVFLNWQQAFTKKIVGGRGARQANRRVQLIYRAVCLDARMAFRNAPIVH